jgi:hypothetical protein
MNINNVANKAKLEQVPNKGAKAASLTDKNLEARIGNLKANIDNLRGVFTGQEGAPDAGETKALSEKLFYMLDELKNAEQLLENPDLKKASDKELSEAYKANRETYLSTKSDAKEFNAKIIELRSSLDEPGANKSEIREKLDEAIAIRNFFRDIRNASKIFMFQAKDEIDARNGKNLPPAKESFRNADFKLAIYQEQDSSFGELIDLWEKAQPDEGLTQKDINAEIKNLKNMRTRSRNLNKFFKSQKEFWKDSSNKEFPEGFDAAGKFDRISELESKFEKLFTVEGKVDSDKAKKIRTEINFLKSELANAS